MLLSLPLGHSFFLMVEKKREVDPPWGGKDRESSIYLKGGGIASNPLERGVILNPPVVYKGME
jgi:hypothetical protein